MGQILAQGNAHITRSHHETPYRKITLLCTLTKVCADGIMYCDSIPGNVTLVSCRGNGASVARIFPYAALHFATYEHYRAGLIRSVQCGSIHTVTNGPVPCTDRPPVWIDLLAGSFSGVTAVAATYPLDLVRTRLAWQLESHDRARSTICRTITNVWQQDGAIGLYRVCLS